jgi:DNA-directed RNA polymerase specialized sigma24 family protein
LVPLAGAGPQKARFFLLLKYVEELTLAEAAAVLEITVDAAKMRHLRAVQRLRTLLADLEHD